MAIDNCYQETEAVHGLQIDIMKCFNGLDHDLALYALQKMGLPPDMAQLWQAQYQRHCARHRYPGSTLGSAYTPPRGIAQGDPLAVLMANAQLSILPRVLERAGVALADLQQWWYLDDSTLLGSSQHTIQQAFELLQTAFDIQALRISIPKTVYFVHEPHAIIRVGSHTIKGTDRLEILGADGHVPHHQPHQNDHHHHGQAHDCNQLQGRNASRWEKVLPRIKLLGHLGGGPQYRTQIATACIAALWRYAPIGTMPSQPQQKGVQRALQVAIFGQGLREAAPELLQSQLLPLHFTHLGYARAYALLRLLRRAWLRGKLTITTMDTVNTPRTYMAHLRAALRSVDLLLQEGEVVSMRTHNALLIYSDTDQRSWLHNLRELFRQDLAHQVAHRRPREYGHCRQGIAREHSFALWRKSRHPTTALVLRAWLSGSLPFKERQWRHHRGPNAPSPFCSWCWHQLGEKVSETVYHMIVDCPFANHHRSDVTWTLIPQLKPQCIETGILDKNHGLTEAQAKQWEELPAECDQHHPCPSSSSISLPLTSSLDHPPVSPNLVCQSGIV